MLWYGGGGYNISRSRDKNKQTHTKFSQATRVLGIELKVSGEVRQLSPGWNCVATTTPQRTASVLQCHGETWYSFVVPQFAIPNYAHSEFCPFRYDSGNASCAPQGKGNELGDTKIAPGGWGGGGHGG